MRITNRTIGKIARIANKYVETRSYSEIRGGRRVKKYWLAFGGEEDSAKFIQELKNRGLPLPTKIQGSSQLINGWGYVVYYLKEEVATEQELIREEELKSMRRKEK